ncbi:MAG TPA: fdrA domain protein [Acidilobales archaeon]|nr:MAG: fdrA domain protein [Desulfurococcales archaeon ex4484_42]HDD26642.1 fdrA domain protein [Acidilobales archaeon]
MVEKVLQLFRSKPKIINIGLEHFYRELKAQGVEVGHVLWQPPPKLEKELEDILSKIL